MTSPSEKFYDRFTWVYPFVDFFLKPQKHKFFSKINEWPGGRLLEIGVGDGAHFKYYNTHEVVGVDTSTRMLARARKHQKNNIQLFQMNGEALLFPDASFDYVALAHVLAVVEHPETLLEEVHRVLKPNGKVFVLNHFTPDNWLKYVDRGLERSARLFHLKSVFHLSHLKTLEKFRLLDEFSAGMFSYFKIVIHEKKV